MSIADQMILAEALRSYFVEHLPRTLLPVPGGYFSLDGLLDEGDSMSLQITGGQTVKRYINGNRKEELAFSIFYRSQNAANDNEAKSAMMGVLNGIGEWLDEQPLPYLGETFTVNRLEQALGANIANQSEQFITYQAGYVLGYQTKGRQ